MANLKVFIWEHREPQGEPDVEVKIPASLAKWVPRMMKLVPKKTKEEVWGGQVDFDEMFKDVEKLLQEISSEGTTEIVDIRAHDSHVKVFVER